MHRPYELIIKIIFIIEKNGKDYDEACFEFLLMNILF
jgi:hypothetical protein